MARREEPHEPSLPRHIAIVMDGNGRWAEQRGKPRLFGHRAGIQSVRRIIKYCGDIGIEALTLYTFSTENWRRPRLEVAGLMRLLAQATRREIAELHANNVRVTFLGRIHELPRSVRVEVERAQDLTANNSGLKLNFAINYSGRTEIVDAARSLARQAASGALSPEEIDDAVISAAMYHPELGDPDLLIRSGGEMRVSNFLLWQIAYTELWVTETLWPDFDEQCLDEAIHAYQSRERRFGGTNG